MDTGSGCHGRERRQAGRYLVLQSRPSAGSRRQATAEAGQRVCHGPEARRALAQAKVDIDAGRLRHGARRTVADLATEWLEAVRPNRKASTFSNYGRLIRAYVVPRIGHVRLDRLAPADVQKLYSDLHSSGGRDGTPLSGTQVRNIQIQAGNPRAVFSQH